MDYYYADNEGHIFVKLSAKQECDIISKGKGFCQGIFVMHGITEDDEAEGKRVGGHGSTDSQN